LNYTCTLVTKYLVIPPVRNFEHLKDNNAEEVIEKTQRKVMDLLRKTVRPEFQEAISGLTSAASKRDLAARQGARTAHSRGYARDE